MAGRISYLGGIVKDGLVLDLDAGKLESYNRVGSVWNNINGANVNGTLINNPTFSSNNGGGIVFDGIDDRGLFTIPITSTSNQTYEVWVKAIPSPTANAGFGYILHINGSGSGRNQINTSYMCIGYAGSTLQSKEIFGVFDGVFVNMGTGVIANSDTVYQIVLTWDGSNQKVYVNGIEKVSTSKTTITNPFSTTTSFGDFNEFTYRPIVGSLYSIKVYNKSLTSTEVLQNYNALKTRFL